MNKNPFSNTSQRINFDKQWAFEVAYFTQNIGTMLSELGNLLNKRDYVEVRLLAAEMKQKAEYEKTLQPEFETSTSFFKARKLFNRFLDECVNFAELLRVTTIQEETACEELLDKPEQIRNSIERLDLLKDMFTDELTLQSLYYQTL